MCSFGLENTDEPYQLEELYDNRNQVYKVIIWRKNSISYSFFTITNCYYEKVENSCMKYYEYIK